MRVARRSAGRVFAVIERRDIEFSLQGAGYNEGDVLVFEAGTAPVLGRETLVAPNVEAAASAVEAMGAAEPRPSAAEEGGAWEDDRAAALLALLDEPAPSVQGEGYGEAASRLLAELEGAPSERERTEPACVGAGKPGAADAALPPDRLKKGDGADASVERMLEVVAGNMLETERSLAAERLRREKLEIACAEAREEARRAAADLEEERSRALSDKGAVAMLESRLEAAEREASAAAASLSDADAATHALEAELAAERDRNRLLEERAARLEKQSATASERAARLEEMLAGERARAVSDAERAAAIEAELAAKAAELEGERARAAAVGAERESLAAQRAAVDEERRALDRMQEDARRMAETLARARDEQESQVRIAHDEDMRRKIGDLEASTRVIADAYESFAAHVKDERESLSDGSDGKAVIESLEDVRNDLERQAAALKEEISAVGSRLAAPAPSMELQTQYGAVVVRHVHEHRFQKAPELTAGQKAAITASRLGDVAKQAVVWVCLCAALSIAATMAANGYDLPTAVSVLYDSTVGRIINAR